MPEKEKKTPPGVDRSNKPDLREEAGAGLDLSLGAGASGAGAGRDDDPQEGSGRGQTRASQQPPAPAPAPPPVMATGLGRVGGVHKVQKPHMKRKKTLLKLWQKRGRRQKRNLTGIGHLDYLSQDLIGLFPLPLLHQKKQMVMKR